MKEATKKREQTVELLLNRPSTPSFLQLLNMMRGVELVRPFYIAFTGADHPKAAVQLVLLVEEGGGVLKEFWNVFGSFLTKECKEQNHKENHSAMVAAMTNPVAAE